MTGGGSSSSTRATLPFRLLRQNLHAQPGWGDEGERSVEGRVKAGDGSPVRDSRLPLSCLEPEPLGRCVGFGDWAMLVDLGRGLQRWPLRRPITGCTGVQYRLQGFLCRPRGFRRRRLERGARRSLLPLSRKRAARLPYSSSSWATARLLPGLLPLAPLPLSAASVAPRSQMLVALASSALLRLAWSRPLSAEVPASSSASTSSPVRS